MSNSIRDNVKDVIKGQMFKFCRTDCEDWINEFVPDLVDDIFEVLGIDPTHQDLPANQVRITVMKV